MTKKILSLMLVLVLALSFAPAALAADGYNDHDLGLLQAFLNQTSATEGMTNGQALGYDSADPSTWTGVTWSEDAEKCVTGIDFGADSSGPLAGPLDVSGCTALETLYCYRNSLTSLDASGCIKLIALNCANNSLTSLNVSDCTALKGIRCSNNSLASLDVSGRSEMTYLYCGSNLLTSLDVSDLTKLAYLECERNQLTSLDVSDLTLLEFVYCFENGLTSLNVSGCTTLMEISCYDNELKSLDVSGLTALLMLSCGSNELTSLDLSTLTSLQTLDYRSNPLPSLDVSGLNSLTCLDCSDTGRTSLDVSALTGLFELECSDNALTELDVSALTRLGMLDCSNNELTELDVSALIWLAELNCSGNALTSLNAGLTRETPPEEMAFQGASLIRKIQPENAMTLIDVRSIGTEDGPYINTVGNPLTQITVDVDGNAISLAATGGGYVEIDGDNYKFIAKPRALGHFVNWTDEGGSEAAATEEVAFNYDTPYNLTANFELEAEVPVGISCTKTDATAYGGSDGSVTITASGGNSGTYEYSIDGGTNWQASGYFSGLAAGTYTAAVRDAANTSNVATQSVTVGQPAYTVTFNTQGGNEIPSALVPENGHVTDPGAPEKTGYTFEGWFKEQACLNPWNFETDTVTGDTTIWALWKQDGIVFSGSGTEANPYRIESAAGLAQLATLVNAVDTLYNDKYYIQTQDIDLSGYNNWTPIGNYVGYTSKAFKGTYNGGGKSISNLNITAYTPTSENYLGLFGYVSGNIRNVNVQSGEINLAGINRIHAGGIVGCIYGSVENCTNGVNINITKSGSTDWVTIGGIAGIISKTGSVISNCRNSGDISGATDTYQAFVGGILGQNELGVQIINCSNSGNIHGEMNTGAGGISGVIGSTSTISQCFNTGSVYIDNKTESGYAGGIAGYSYRTTITNCFNIGTISEKSDTYTAWTGGILGGDVDSSQISYCYNVGAIRGDKTGQFGGIIGTKGSTGSISYCYYADTCAVGIGTGTGTTYKKTINEMKLQATFTYYDFGAVWTMSKSAETNYNCPQLQANLFSADRHNTGLAVNSEQGTVEGSGDYAFLDTVTITATAKDKYTFKNWAVSSGGVTLANPSGLTTSFVMPYNDVSIQAVFEGVKYDLTLESGGNGTVSGGGLKSWGTTVPITATANTGYQFLYWEVVSGGAVISDDWDMTATLVMPESDVTIRAVFGPNPTVFTVSVANEKATITGYNGGGGSIPIPEKINGYRVTEIGNRAFYNKTSLTGVQIPDTVRIINTEAFSGCSSLASVSLGNGVTDINYLAFSRCTGITNLVIPDNVLNLVDLAFDSCINLGSVSIGEGTQSIGSGIFRNCPKITNFTVAAENSCYKSQNNVVYNKSGTELICYPAGRFGGFSIPQGVTTIHDYAFSYSSLLTSIQIPGTVTTIERNAFENCAALTSVTLPDDIETINQYTFASCPNLTGITIPDSVNIIGNNAFYNSIALTDVTIGNGVQSIGANAFAGCNINTVAFPHCLSSLGNNAFASNRGLKEAYFEGPQPGFDYNSVFYNVSSGFKVYYHVSEATSWTTFDPNKKQAYCLLTRNLLNGQTPETSIAKLNIFKLPAIPDPAWAGHTFLDWYKDKDCTDKWAFELDIAEDDVTLYAKWRVDRCNVSASANDPSYGTVTGMGIYGVNSSVTLTAVPAQGCRFIRWTEKDAEVSTDKEYTFTVTDDRTLVAEFAEIGVPEVAISCPAYNSLNLTWDPLGGAAAYEVCRSTSRTGTYTKVSGETELTETSFTDSGLITGKTYFYIVRGYYTAEGVTDYGYYCEAVSAMPVPSAPATVTASEVDYDSIKVEWAAVDGASGYLVYRSTSENGSYTNIATTSRTYYTNNYIATGTTYYYKVRAYRSSTSLHGNYSTVAAIATDLKPMENVAASTYYPTAIKISWNAVPGRTKYYVYRSDTPDGEYKYIGSTTYTYYKNTGLAVDKTYYYKVRAYRLVGTKKVYNELSEYVSDTARVFQVTNVKARMYSATSNKIYWSSVPGISGYEILGSESEDGVYSLIGKTGYTYYYNKNLVPNKTYYYKVQAYRTVGSAKHYGPESVSASAMPVFNNVTNVNALMYSVTSNRITWSPVSGRTGYEVSWSESEDGTYTKLPVTAYTYIYDNGIDPAKAYYYKVAAYVTVNGVRQYSAESAPVRAYNKVNGVKGYMYSVTSNKIYWSPVASRSKYEVSWSESKDGTYTMLPATTYTYIYHTNIDPGKTYYYKVLAYQTINGKKVYTSDADVVEVISKVRGAQAVCYSYSTNKISWSSVSGRDYYEIWRYDAAADDYLYLGKTGYTYYYDKNLTTDTTYYYKVRASDTVSGGIKYSGFSDVVSAKPILKAVSGARAVRYNSTKIKLTWYSVSGATGYEIESCTAGNDFVNIKTTTTTSTYYYNGGLSHGTKYYYRVRAYRTVGENTYHGEWSKVVYATP